jgi:hypothetical protein
VTLTITTPATAINGGNVPTIDPTTGTVVVPQNTPAGSYTMYTKSVITKPYQCDTTVTVNVAPSIDAPNDTIAVANGTTGILRWKCTS